MHVLDGDREGPRARRAHEEVGDPVVDEAPVGLARLVLREGARLGDAREERLELGPVSLDELADRGRRQALPLGRAPEVVLLDEGGLTRALLRARDPAFPVEREDLAHDALERRRARRLAALGPEEGDALELRDDLELVEEARLPDPRLAEDEDDERALLVAGRGVRESLREHVELASAPHEARGEDVRVELDLGGRALHGARLSEAAREVGERGVRRGVAVGRVLLEEPEDEARPALGDVVADLGRRLGDLLEVLPYDGEGGASVVGELARHGVVEGDAEGVEVGPVVGGLFLRDLGGNVVDGALDLAAAARRRLAGEAEVHELHDVARASVRSLGGEDLHVQVLGLHVVVHEAAVVDVGEGLEDLARDLVEPVPVDPVRRLVEVNAVEELARVVAAALGQAEVIDLDEVRVVEPGEELELVLEVLEVPTLRLEELVGEGTVLLDGVLDLEHLAHAAFAELALDAVSPVE